MQTNKKTVPYQVGDIVKRVDGKRLGVDLNKQDVYQSSIESIRTTSRDGKTWVMLDFKNAYTSRGIGHTLNTHQYDLDVITQKLFLVAKAPGQKTSTNLITREMLRTLVKCGITLANDFGVKLEEDSNNIKLNETLDNIIHNVINEDEAN